MRNIRRLQNNEALFKKFTEVPNPESGRPIFTTMRDFLCFLAVLGFKEGVRTPLTGNTIELDSRVFESHEQSKDILFLIALTSAKDANILHPDREDEMVMIFEEFVATGSSVLESWLKNRPDDHLGDQALLDALRQEELFKGHSMTLETAISQIEF